MPAFAVPVPRQEGDIYVSVGSELLVCERLILRMGYGTMRLTGAGIQGPPPDRRGAVRLLRSAATAGVQLFDTAWYYGPDVTNDLLQEALHPYDPRLLIVTKLGNMRRPDGSWAAAVHPQELRAACERDLRTLRLDSAPLTLLRWRSHPSPEIPFEDAFAALVELKQRGLIQHVGLSNVTLQQFEQAQQITTVAAVSNLYNLLDRGDDRLLERCESEGIPYLPYYPLAAGRILKEASVVAAAARLRTPPATLALAWLLARSPAILPIPGTGSERHLAENVRALTLTATKAQWTAFNAITGDESASNDVP